MLKFDPEQVPLVEALVDLITGQELDVAKDALLYVLASVICMRSLTPKDAQAAAAAAAETLQAATPEMWGELRAMGPGGFMPTAGNA
jgi:hypothetical protein